MGKTADETKGKTKGRRKNPQPSHAPDCTVSQTDNPPIAEPSVAAPTTTVLAAEVPQETTEAAPTPSGEVPTAVQTVSDPPTQNLPPTPSMPAANLDPLHMLKELVISMSSVGDPSVLFARLAEELLVRKSLVQPDAFRDTLSPRTFTESTTLQSQQNPCLHPQKTLNSYPLNLPKLRHSPQPKLNSIQPSRRRRRLREAKKRSERQRSLTVVKARRRVRKKEMVKLRGVPMKERGDSGETWDEQEEAEGSGKLQSVEGDSDLERYAEKVDEFLEKGKDGDVVVVDESVTVDERAARMSSRLARRLSEVTVIGEGKRKPSDGKETRDDAPANEEMLEARDETPATKETEEEEMRAKAERKCKGKQVALLQQKKAKPTTTHVEIRESPPFPHPGTVRTARRCR